MVTAVTPYSQVIVGLRKPSLLFCNLVKQCVLPLAPWSELGNCRCGRGANAVFERLPHHNNPGLFVALYNR